MYGNIFGRDVNSDVKKPMMKLPVPLRGDKLKNFAYSCVEQSHLLIAVV